MLTQIEALGKGSPADKAGIKRSDVLRQLDDQIHVSPEQGEVLISRKKAGDSVKVAGVRMGTKPSYLNSTIPPTPMYRKRFEPWRRNWGRRTVPPHADLQNEGTREQRPLPAAGRR